jgi:hypothetical protein
LALIEKENATELVEEANENPLTFFMYALKAPETRRHWPRRLKIFLDYLDMDGDRSIEEEALQLVNKARQNPRWLQESLFRFMALQCERVRRGEISGSTIPNYYKAVKLFCEMKDIVLNWKKILCGLPRSKQAANDRAPTIEEIQKLVEFPDRRIKPIIYTLASSGIRMGAWDYLRWKHIVSIKSDQGEVVAARIPLLLYYARAKTKSFPTTY